MTPSLMTTMMSPAVRSSGERYTFLPRMFISSRGRSRQTQSCRRIACGLSNSNRLPFPSLFMWMTEKVEYATPRTLHTGRDCTIVSMQSSMETSLETIVHRILEVSVERIFAFTPLPSPSARTSVV